MTDEEIKQELDKRELELATQAEWEFDEVLLPKVIKALQKTLKLEEDMDFLNVFKESLKMAFVNGVHYGFLKYIENRLEQKKESE